MAIVVESVSAVVSVSAAATVTITKPTGLAVGDLMIATLSAFAGDGSGSGDINLKSVWTAASTTTFLPELANSIQYKIADSADVAASNFAFTKSTSTDNFSGQLIRASGHNTLNPLGFADTYVNDTAESATFAGTLDSYTPGSDGALVVIQVNGVWSTGSTARTVSDYTTSGVTHTEGIDTYTSDGSGGAFVASAYGIQTTAAAITTYGATISTSTPDHYGQIAIFIPPVNASGTNTLVTTTSTTSTQSGTNDGIVGNTLATATSEAFTQSGTGTSPTTWTNESKNTSTWANEEKS